MVIIYKTQKTGKECIFLTLL